MSSFDHITIMKLVVEFYILDLWIYYSFYLFSESSKVLRFFR